MQNNRSWTVILFSLLALLLLPTFATAAPTPATSGLAGRRPNVILILVDDLGYGDLGRNGNPVLKTPHLDAFYDQAVHFEDFHVSPCCSPTRAALMTGRHEFRCGVTHTILERERLRLDETTVAQALKAAGYSTGIFGKWHLGDEDAYQPDRRGFDEVFIHGGGGIGQTYPGSCGDAPRNTYFDPVIKHDGTFEKTHGFCTDVFFRQATSWIDAVKDAKGRDGTDKPFFCYLATNAAHEPLSCPPEYEKPYDGKVSKKAAKFFGMIGNIDDNVGRLMDHLQQRGLDERTLVIYMNDNGGYPPAMEVWNAGMRGGKVTAYNGGTRAFSLWRWPGAIKPAACDNLTAHLDVLPTLAELAGAPVPSNLDGFSLVPLLEDPTDSHARWHSRHDDRILFTHVGRWGGDTPGVEPQKLGNGLVSVRRHNHLLVYEKGGWHLYDLSADPGEKTDIAARQPEEVAELSAAYDKWWDEVRPRLSNEQAWKTAPAVNPFKQEYWKQFNGPGPNNAPPPADGH